MDFVRVRSPETPVFLSVFANDLFCDPQTVYYFVSQFQHLKNEINTIYLPPKAIVAFINQSLNTSLNIQFRRWSCVVSLHANSRKAFVEVDDVFVSRIVSLKGCECRPIYSVTYPL